jgi:outer membrane protein assembly factor BamB
MRKRLFWVMCFGGILVVSGSLQAAVRDVAGRVFIDTNQNGVWDSGEKGFGGVEVSDGQGVVTAGSDGKYSLKADPQKSPFVFICTPSGYKNSPVFYLKITPEKKDFNFGLFPAAETAAEAFSFVHVADLHIGIGGAESVKTFLEDVREIKGQAEKPRFIIPTGDLVTQGSDLSSYEDYRRAVLASGIPFYQVIGNHDAPVENYEKYLGPTYYSFDYGQKHFVVLNCLEPARYAEWLKKDMALQPKKKGVLVFQHYQPDKGLLELLSGYPVQAFFYGHWHSNKVFFYKNILVATSAPMRFGGIDCNPRGFRLVTVEKDGSLRTQFRWGGAKPKLGLIPTGVKGGTLVWSRNAGGQTGMSNPRIENGRMYIGLQDDHNALNAGVICLDAGNGKVLWKFKTDSSVNGAPAVRDGIVCIVSVTGTMYGVDAVTGKGIWTSSLGEFCDRWVYNSPVIADGIVYCGTAPYFAALDLKSGKEIWRAPSMGGDWISCRTSPTKDEKMVFTGVNWTNGLFALDRQNGKVVWNKKQGFGTTHSSPVVYGKTVFYAADSMLYALNKSDGKELWHTALPGGWPVSTPAIQDGLVVVGTPEGKIAAFDAGTGRNLWSVATGEALGSFSAYTRDGSQVMSTPTISKGKVYVGSNDGRLYVIDLKTGKCLWKPNLGFPILSSPAVIGDIVYVARWDGVILALRP